MQKSHRRIIAIVLPIVAVLIQFLLSQQQTAPSQKTQIQPSISIELTRHARCRMHCRQIRQEEIEDVVLNGSVNKNKSNPVAQPCPVVAKEKISSDQQKIRVVYGECQNRYKIITVIDLDQNHKCDCE